jgi:hypothetical protein
MAGFDMDAPAGEQNPTEMLSGVTLKSWQEDKLDWDKIEACRQAGVSRFTSSAQQAMAEIDKLVPDGANVFFAHTMAGGIPRSRPSWPLPTASTKAAASASCPRAPCSTATWAS